MSEKLSEKHFQAQVAELARLSGWLTYHTHDSRHSQAGIPDLVLVRVPVVLFAELKSESGRIRPGQGQWLEALGDSESVEARLWRPSDWPETERRGVSVYGTSHGRRPMEAATHADDVREHDLTRCGQASEGSMT